MTSTSTLRLPGDLRQWIDTTAADGGVSANRCIELLIRHAKAHGWSITPAAVVPLPEDVPQVGALLSEDRPADTRKWTD